MDKDSWPVRIIRAYKQYVDYGYPRDTNCYEIRAEQETMELLCSALRATATIPKLLSEDEDPRWSGMKLVVNNRLPKGIIQVSPEIVELCWED